MTDLFVFKVRMNIADLFHRSHHQEVFTAALQKAETLEHFVLKLIGFCGLSYLDNVHWLGVREKNQPDVWLENAQGQIEVALYIGELSLGELQKYRKHANKVVCLVADADAWYKELSPHLIAMQDIRIFSLSAEFVSQLAAALSRSLHWDVIIDNGVISVSDKVDYYQSEIIKLH
ncbi:hypothetical protein CWB99_02650 [Pseudoalteromonas rubra]|uniref:YaeQ family protein n=1 Tax=Pseudoalteromonas rubra TaxID=43658 RepID=A0A5S3WS44_9GAMM|nr:YaeQ family protein [Pseudoalteromonas rubra]TMP30253.1 hypothetical protein CWC00_17835 [Pseudoalteromonas rubra]TMP31877.1 hypothetical protein CWB99_02650 [Pseudoalteromonas rubra]